MTGPDAETRAVYDAMARDYADLVGKSAPDRDLAAFLTGLPEGGRVLDLGCGPGNAAAMMAESGFIVDAFDASEKMVAIAAQHPGVTVWQAAFADLDAHQKYDGIWANFSLLHAPRPDLPGHFAQIKRALKPGGRLHLGMKTGHGEKRDSLGRLYTYCTEQELRAMLEHSEMTVLTTRHGSSTGLAGTSDPFVILTAHA